MPKTTVELDIPKSAAERARLRPKTTEQLNRDYEAREHGRLDRKTAILVNDLDSMVHRIEELQAHPKYTDALLFVQSAKQALKEGRSDIHQSYLRERFKSG